MRREGGVEGTEKMNIERPTSNFEWEKMKKLRKVERKKLGRWEDEKVGEKQDWGMGSTGEGETERLRGGISW